MRRALAPAILFLLPFAAQANFELTLQAHHSTVPVKGVEKLKGDSKEPADRTIHLSLGKRWFQWSDGTNGGVYDFDKRLVIFIDPETHQLDERSLYASVVERRAELENRLTLGGALEAGKVADNPMAPTIDEHQLSIRRDARRPSQIKRVSADGEQRYLWSGKELFTDSAELIKLPPDARDLYVRYVRYTIGGHPEILDDLQKLDGIPKWIRCTDPAYGDVQRLEVIEVKQTPDAGYVLPPLGKATLKDPRAAAAAAVVMGSTAASRAAALSNTLSTANAAADGGKPLEAMLGYLEWGLMSDGGLPSDFQQRRDSILRDANVNALIGVFQARTAAQTKSNIPLLNRLALVAGSKGYVVGIFRANGESNLGNTEASANLLIEALAKNPFITGVWKDLGDDLGGGFSAAESWRCYEIARLIAPNHKLLAPVSQREASLLKEYPEFF